MAIHVGEHRFDHARYDAEGDVLYLCAGEPQAATLSNASPEGHALRYDEAGTLVGVTIVNARWLLEQDGAITITIPERVRVGPEELGPALVVEV